MHSTNSSINRKTVFKVFQDMSLGSEPVELDYVKSWVSEWMPDFSVRDLKEKCPWFSNNEFNTNYPSLSDAETVLGVFNTHKDDLIKMLVLLNYTWDVAEKIVEIIIEDFQSALLETRLLPPPDKNGYFHVIVIDPSLFGRYLSSALCYGIHFTQVLVPDDVLIPFYCFFIQKCYESSIPNIISLDQRLHIREDLMNNIQKIIQIIPCPMIIFEDADIASAVSSFCKSVCKFKTTSSDVVTHLIIQENVFDITISYLKSALKKMRHGSRLDKKTELEYIIPSEEIETSSHNLEIFTPCEKSPIKLFVGWNPTDTDQSDQHNTSRGHIPTIPFKNSDDLGILLKELQLDNNIVSLSVWSEKMSNIRKFPCELPFSTLWINSHSLTHPLLPHNLSVYKPLLWIRSNESSLPESAASIDILTVIRKSHYYENNLDKALEDAMKTFKTWHLNKAEMKLKIVEPIWKVFASSRQETQSQYKSVNEMIKPLINTALSECLASKAKVMIEYSQVGVVLVFVKASYEKLKIDLTRLVSSLLIQGNVVIVASYQKILKHSAVMLEQIYKITSSNNLLTFLELNSRTMFQWVYNIRQTRCIYIGDDINSPISRNNCNEYCVDKKDNYLHDDEYCLRLSTISKSTWFL